MKRFCIACHVWLNSDSQFDRHCSGEKHRKAAIRAAKAVKPVDVRDVKADVKPVDVKDVKQVSVPVYVKAQEYNVLRMHGPGPVYEEANTIVRMHGPGPVYEANTIVRMHGPGPM